MLTLTLLTLKLLTLTLCYHSLLPTTGSPDGDGRARWLGCLRPQRTRARARPRDRTGARARSAGASAEDVVGGQDGPRRRVETAAVGHRLEPGLGLRTTGQGLIFN